MKTAWMFALLLCVSAVPCAETQDESQSVDESGNAFLSLCQDALDSSSTKHSAAQLGECFGYIEGVNHGVRIAYDIMDQRQPYCLPDGVTHGQMMRVLIKFIKDHPEKAHNTTGTLEVESFMDAFPCKRPERKR